MTTPTLSDEVAFISSVSSSNTLAQTSYFAWTGSTPATYASYVSARKWGSSTGETPGGTVDYYFNPSSKWTATEEQWFSAAFALWSAVANISFVQTANSANAQITITRGTDGSAYTSVSLSTYSGSTSGSSNLDTITRVSISIDTRSNGFGPISGFGAYGGYPLETLLHEEGHALGFGHAGPYDGSVNASTQQFSPYDSRLWSVMSYIDPGTTSAKYYSVYPVKGTNWSGHYPTTPMIADILAAQRLYGTPVNTPLSGGQIFGFHTNISGPIEPYFDFTKNKTPVITIWDKGGHNTLDLSGFTGAAHANLNAGTFSSTSGLKNNIGIAYGTKIDTLVCTAGGTAVTCNNDGDKVTGGAGNDVITGGTGNDTLMGGAGNDTIDGGAGTNIIYGGPGTDTALFSGDASQYKVVRISSSTVAVSGNGVNDTLTAIEVLQFADKPITLLASTVLASANLSDTAVDLTSSADLSSGNGSAVPPSGTLANAGLGPSHSQQIGWQPQGVLEASSDWNRSTMRPLGVFAFPTVLGAAGGSLPDTGADLVKPQSLWHAAAG